MWGDSLNKSSNAFLVLIPITMMVSWASPKHVSPRGRRRDIYSQISTLKMGFGSKQYSLDRLALLRERIYTCPFAFLSNYWICLFRSDTAYCDGGQAVSMSLSVGWLQVSGSSGLSDWEWSSFLAFIEHNISSHLLLKGLK